MKTFSPQKTLLYGIASTVDHTEHSTSVNTHDIFLPRSTTALNTVKGRYGFAWLLYSLFWLEITV